MEKFDCRLHKETIANLKKLAQHDGRFVSGMARLILEEGVKARIDALRKPTFPVDRIENFGKLW